MKYLFLSIAILCTLASCKNKPQDTEATTAEATPTDVYVDTEVLHPKTFHRQLICNGRLRAMRKSEMSFPSGGIVTAILVKNGSRVTAGQPIARTDDSEARLSLEKAQKELERANIELSDKLIGLGYKGIHDNVPADVMRRARVSSGWFQAEYSLRDARRQLSQCVLRAPFSGLVAALTNLRHQRIDKICDIVDDNTMRVEFEVLEAELKNVRRGMRVLVTPFTGGRTVTGSVVDINPEVSDKGLILVTATVPNANGKMLDGENVRVVIEGDVPSQFVVPKDAVVERDGYHVVFILHDGEAVWTYVDIAHSNATQHAITGNAQKETELHSGDTIITSGNLNLADGTPVKVRKKK